MKRQINLILAKFLGKYFCAQISLSIRHFNASKLPDSFTEMMALRLTQRLRLHFQKAITSYLMLLVGICCFENDEHFYASLGDLLFSYIATVFLFVALHIDIWKANFLDLFWKDVTLNNNLSVYCQLWLPHYKMALPWAVAAEILFQGPAKSELATTKDSPIRREASKR